MTKTITKMVKNGNGHMFSMCHIVMVGEKTKTTKKPVCGGGGRGCDLSPWQAKVIY